MDPAGTAEEIVVTDSPSCSRAISLRSSTSRSIEASHDRSSARASCGPEIVCTAPERTSALAQDPLDDPQHSLGVGLPIGLADPERSDRERHRGVSPLRGAALIAVRHGIAGTDVGEELGRRRAPAASR